MPLPENSTIQKHACFLKRRDPPYHPKLAYFGFETHVCSPPILKNTNFPVHKARLETPPRTQIEHIWFLASPLKDTIVIWDHHLGSDLGKYEHHHTAAVAEWAFAIVRTLTAAHIISLSLPHHHEDKIFCPLSFWGASRRVERWEVGWEVVVRWRVWWGR
jgi:hypothetical protein